MIVLITTLEPSRIALLPQFVAHYRKLGVERFFLSLHLDPSLGTEEAARAQASFEAMLDRIGIGEAFYYRGLFQMAPFALYKSEFQASHVAPEDWIVWADIDEFHVYPPFPSPILHIIERCKPAGINYMNGTMIDRIAADGSLPEFDPARSIWDQFPVACLVTKDLAKGELNKVVLAEGWIQLAHGCHVPALARPEQSAPLRISKEEHPKLKTALGKVQVHHFKWDASVIARLRDRVTPEYRAKHFWWAESQRLLDYFERNGMKFDFRDLSILALKGSGLIREPAAPQSPPS